MVEPVLLLHGQPGSARDWDPLRAAIGDRTLMLALNRPGWDGGSRASDLAGNAAAALAALDAHGADRATVVGHSFGAAVAAELALSHPQRVTALVLVAPSANVASLYRLDYLLAAPIAGELGALLTLGCVGLALASSKVRNRAAHELAVDDAYLRYAGRMLRDPARWRTFAAEQRALVRELPALESRLGGVSAPAKIVVGEADRVVPLASAQLLARQIPDAELTVLPRGGHLLPQQCPGALAEVIATTAGPVSGAVTARE
jgi:pimeloyl-ACP methyl ester carboxylesterase